MVQDGNLTASVEDGALKIDGYAAVNNRLHYLVGYTLTVGREYTLTFDLKVTAGEGTSKIAFQVKDYKNNAIILNVSGNSPNAWSADFSSYKTITHKFTADLSTSLELRPMQVAAGTATVYIKNITLAYAVDQTQTVESGAAIGTLPEIPAKEGYNKGYWTIDDKEITAETVYNYGADKTAVIKYIKENTLTYVTSEKRPSQNYSDYYKNNLGDTSCVASDNNSIAIAFTKAETDRAEIKLGTELGLTEGKTYYTTFTLWMEKAPESSSNLAVHIFELHVNLNQPTKQWLSSGNYKEATPYKYENEFTYNSSVYGGIFSVLIKDAQGAGTVHVSDIVVKEVTKTTVVEGTAIGELPAIPEKVGYTGAWTIDDTAISSETTYNYGTDKTAVIKYTPVTYTLTFKDIDGNTVGDETYTYTVESDKGTLNKPAVPQIDSKDGEKFDGVWSGWEEFDVKQGGDKTFTAAYPDLKVSFTFEDSKGENQTVEYAFGAQIGELPVLNVTGYVGVWKIGDIEITADYAIRDTEDLTVTAVYTVIEYTITFKILGETEALGTAKYTVETDPSTIVYPTVPEKDGSTDGEWEEVNLKNGGDVTVLFTYAERYTVEFKDEAGNVTETVKVTVGKKIGTLPELPAKKGYTGEWKSGDTVITADTVVNENMTVTAVYTKNSGCGAAVDGTVIVLNLVALAVCAAIVIRKNKLQK